MNARNASAKKVSLRAGCGATAVHDILSGKNRNPSDLVLKSIATALSCPVDFFKEFGVSSDGPMVVPLIVEPNIEVIGVAETGAYREEKETGAIIKKIAGPAHKRFPDAKPYALEMRDKSMDRAVPFPLVPGTFACFIDIAEAGGMIEPGKLYVVRRRLAGTQSGTMLETLIRRAVKNGTGTVLRAEFVGRRAVSRHHGQKLVDRRGARRLHRRISLCGYRLRRRLMCCHWQPCNVDVFLFLNSRATFSFTR